MFRACLSSVVILTLALALVLVVSACGRPTRAGTTDIAGVMPRLEFSMIRATDGAPVTEESYRGRAVLLYFGYTHCPDECPATLANITAALARLERNARDVRVLFVTVDPGRDSVPELRSYVRAFGPEIDGLRGGDDAIAALARRYRVIYAVTPASPGHAWSVMHSDSVFMFDRNGHARFVTTSTTDAAALAKEIQQLM